MNKSKLIQKLARLPHYAALAVLSLAAGTAWADRLWTGAVDTDWSSAGNWDGSSGTYCFKGTGWENKALVTFGGYHYIYDALWVQNDKENTYPLVFRAVDSSKGIESSAALNVAPDGTGDGSLVIEEGVYTFSAANIGGQKDGSLLVKGGSFNSTGKMTIGCNSGTKTGTLALSGGKITVGNSIEAGSTAGTTGAIIISNGTFTAKSYTCLGVSGTGVFEMHGGVYNQTGNAFIVGQGSGIGTATVTNGTMNLTGYAGNYDTDNSLYIGEGGGGGTMAIGGKAIVNATKKILVGVKGEGTLNITGGKITSSEEMRVGVYGKNAGGQPGHVNMSGGELDVNTLTIGRGGTGDMTVSGTGKVKMQNDSYVGYNTSGTLTIRDGGWATCGYSGRNKWLKLNGDSSTTGTSMLNLDTNGVLEVMSIKTESGNGGSIINFNGGTLRAYADESKGIVQNNEKLSVIVKVGGAIIDIPSGITTEVNRPLLTDATSTGGGLIKQGAGTLTLVTGNTYTGATTIEGGTLNLPDGAFANNTPAGGLVLKGGTLSGTAQTWSTLEIAGGVYSYSDISSLSTGAIALSGGTICMTATEAADSTRRAITVTGGRIVVDGSTAATPPKAGSTLTITGVTLSGVAESAVFVVSCTPTLDWTAAASGSDYTLTAATATDTSVNVWIGGSVGNWNDAVNWQYGVPTSTQTVQIDDDCTIAIWGWMDNIKSMCGDLVVNGNATIVGQDFSASHYDMLFVYGLGGSEAAVRGNGKIILTGNTGLQNQNASAVQTLNLPIDFASTDNHTWLGGNTYGWNVTGHARIIGKPMQSDKPVDFRGGLIIDAGAINATSGDATVSGGLTVNSTATLQGSKAIVVSGSITGSGAITASCAVTLSGDNSDFEGSFSTTVSGTTFATAASGSAKADWILKGNTFFSFASGTIEFGSLDFSNYNDSSTFAYDYSDNADGATVAVKVGAKGDSTITETGSSGHRDVFTGYSGNTWTVDKFNGTIQKVGANTTLTLSGTPTAIDSLQIDAGTLILPDGVTVGTLTLASGVCVRPAISYDSGYTVAKLTATSATVTGAKIQLSDDSISALGTGKGGTELDIIEAVSGNLTGSADTVVYTTSGQAVDADTDAKTLWTASTANDKVSISASALATANDTSYYSLADAVAATQDTGALITLNLDTAEDILIPAGKTISFTAGSATYRGTVSAADGTVVTANASGIYTYTCPLDFNDVEGVEGSSTYSRTNIDNTEPLEVATGSHYFTNWRLDVPSDYADKQGSLVLSSGTKLDVHNEVQIGVKDNGVGSLTVTGGAQLDADTYIALGHGTGSSVTLKADNGTVTTDGTLYLGCHSGGTGSSGTSTVDVRNNGSVTAKGIGLPNAANSTHTINLTGDGTGTINFGGGKRAYLGQGNPSETALTIDGAKVSGIGIISMGYGNNVTSRLYMVSGELTMTDKFDMGELSGGYAKLVQSGGAITATAMQLGGNYQESTKTAYGIAEFSGGSFSVNEVYFGWSGKGNGSITVSGTANVSLGAVDFGKNSKANTSEAVTLNDGTLAAASWTRSAVADSTVMTFNGGTLKATAASSDWIPSGITKVFGGALTFESDNNVTINMANSSVADATTPSLTKTGTGTLTLSDASVFTGGITLSAGSLVLPSSYENVTSGVEGRIAARTTSGSTSTWTLAAAAVVSGGTTTYKNTVEEAIADALAAESYDYVLACVNSTLSLTAENSGVKMKADGTAQITVSLPNAYEYDYSTQTDGNGVTTYTFSNKACTYTWAGDAAGAYWNSAGSWRYNTTETATRVPNASDSVIFPTGDWIVKIADASGTDKFGTMTVNGNVTLQRSGNSWVYLQCNGNIGGTGTLLLNSCCLYNNTTGKLTVGCNLAAIHATNDSAMIGRGSGGNWEISGNVEIRGFFKSDNIPTVVTGNATIKTNAKFQTYDQPITFTGTTTFESSYERASKGGTLTFGDMIVAANVTFPSVDSTAINGNITINDGCSLTLPSSNISLSTGTRTISRAEGASSGSITFNGGVDLGVTSGVDDSLTINNLSVTFANHVWLGALNGLSSTGDAPKGSLILNNCTTSVSGEFMVARYDYCPGEVTVNGGTLTSTASGSAMTIGLCQYNTGKMTVTGGATVSVNSGNLDIGGRSGKNNGIGELVVDYGTVESMGDLLVANGQGTQATIIVGGSANAASITIGSTKPFTVAAGSNSSASITVGANSSISGANTMSLNSGATVTMAGGTLSATSTTFNGAKVVVNSLANGASGFSSGTPTISADSTVTFADAVSPATGDSLIAWTSQPASGNFALVGNAATRGYAVTQDATGLKVAAGEAYVTAADGTKTAYATLSSALSAAQSGEAVTCVNDYDATTTPLALNTAGNFQMAEGKTFSGTINATSGEIVATGDELATAFAGATINVSAAGSVTIPAGIKLTNLSVGDGGTVNVSGTITGTTVDANGTIGNGSTLFTLTAATPAFAATTVHAVALDADIHYTMSAVESAMRYTAGAVYKWTYTTDNKDISLVSNYSYWNDASDTPLGSEADVPTLLDTAIFNGGGAKMGGTILYNILVEDSSFIFYNYSQSTYSIGGQDYDTNFVIKKSSSTGTVYVYNSNGATINFYSKLLGCGTFNGRTRFGSNELYLHGDTSSFTGHVDMQVSNANYCGTPRVLNGSVNNPNSSWSLFAQGFQPQYTAFAGSETEYVFGSLKMNAYSRDNSASKSAIGHTATFYIGGKGEDSYITGGWLSAYKPTIVWTDATATFTNAAANTATLNITGGGKAYVSSVPGTIGFDNNGGTLIIDDNNASVADDILGSMTYAAGTVGFDVADGITASATGRDTFSGASFKKSGYGTVSLTGAFESIGTVTVTEGKLIISTTISSELPIDHPTSTGTLCEVSNDNKTYTFYTAAVTYGGKNYSTIADAVAAAKAASDATPAITLNVSSSENVTIPAGVTLTIANGATYSGVLTVDVSSTELNTTVLTTSGEGTFSGTFVVADKDDTIYAVTRDGETNDYKYTYVSTVYVWKGGDETKPTDCNTKANWLKAGAEPSTLPGKDDTIFFPADATIDCSTTDATTFNIIKIATGATVTMSGGDGDSDKVYVKCKEISTDGGAATFTMKSLSLADPSAGDGMTISDDITLNVSGTCYIKSIGNNSEIHIRGGLAGDVNSEVNMRSGSSGGSIKIYGNNSAFYGTMVTKDANTRLSFRNAGAGLPNGVMKHTRDELAVIGSGFTDGGTLEFGGWIDTGYKTDGYYYTRIGNSGATLKIGAVGTSETVYVLGRSVAENKNGNEKIRLQKVGASVLKVGRTMATYGADIDGGVLELVYDGAITENIQSDKFVTFGGGTLRYGTSCTDNTTKIVTDISAHIKNSTSAISVETTGTDVSWDTALDSSNTGGITKKGAGTLTLTKKPLMTKPTITVQDSGTLVISNATALVAGTDFTCGDWTVCEETPNKDDSVNPETVTSYTYTFRMFSVTVSSTESKEVTGTAVSVDGNWIAANMSSMTMEEASAKLKSAAVADHASNGYSYLANYALGLDPAEATSKPFVAGAASASYEGTIALKLSGIKVPEGVTVTAQLQSCATPDGTFTDVSGKTGTATGTAEGVTETSAIEVDASAAAPVIYYRLGVTFGGTVVPS